MFPYDLHAKRITGAPVKMPFPEAFGVQPRGVKAHAQFRSDYAKDIIELVTGISRSAMENRSGPSYVVRALLESKYGTSSSSRQSPVGRQECGNRILFRFAP